MTRRSRRTFSTRQLAGAAASFGTVAAAAAVGAPAAQAYTLYFNGCAQPATNYNGVWAGYNHGVWDWVDTYATGTCSGTGNPYACTAASFHKSTGVTYDTSPICQGTPSVTESTHYTKWAHSEWLPQARVCHACEGHTFNHKQYTFASQSATN
jgi:hypothetical protein